MMYDFNENKEYTKIIDRDEKKIIEKENSVALKNDDIKEDTEEEKENCDNIKKDTNIDIVTKDDNNEKDIIENKKETVDNENDIANIPDNIKNKEETEKKKTKNIENLDILKEEDVSVFKMDAEEILDELTLSQKKTLLALGTKFSPVDYVKMRDYLYMSDREEGVSRALQLAERRLTEEDFKKMEDAIDEYIDFETIEKKD